MLLLLPKKSFRYNNMHAAASIIWNKWEKSNKNYMNQVLKYFPMVK